MNSFWNHQINCIDETRVDEGRNVHHRPNDWRQKRTFDRFSFRHFSSLVDAPMNDSCKQRKKVCQWIRKNRWMYEIFRISLAHLKQLAWWIIHTENDLQIIRSIILFEDSIENTENGSLIYFQNEKNQNFQVHTQFAQIFWGTLISLLSVTLNKNMITQLIAINTKSRLVIRHLFKSKNLNRLSGRHQMFFQFIVLDDDLESDILMWIPIKVWYANFISPLSSNSLDIGLTKFCFIFPKQWNEENESNLILWTVFGSLNLRWLYQKCSQSRIE